MITLYLAGPMRSLPLLNFPAFDAGRDYLFDLGYAVYSPADLDRAAGVDESQDDDEADFQGAMRRDFKAIAKCDGMAFLPGWEKSVGAAIERRAAIACGLQLYRVDPEARTFEPEVIIGLSGYARAGKDTAANIIAKELGFKRVGFADALKDLALRINPSLPVEHNGSAGTHYPLASLVRQYGWEAAKGFPSVRQYLQILGTEACRESLGQDVWVETLFRRETAPRLVISDVRFPNELQAIRDRGGIVLRINRPFHGAANAHASETALDSADFDVVIENDGTLEDLREKVLKAVAGLGL